MCFMSEKQIKLFHLEHPLLTVAGLALNTVQWILSENIFQ